MRGVGNEFSSCIGVVVAYRSASNSIACFRWVHRFNVDFLGGFSYKKLQVDFEAHQLRTRSKFSFALIRLEFRISNAWVLTNTRTDTHTHTRYHKLHCLLWIMLYQTNKRSNCCFELFTAVKIQRTVAYWCVNFLTFILISLLHAQTAFVTPLN